MDYRNIITDFLFTEKIFLENRKYLIVLLGSFADFDSFEYAINLKKFISDRQNKDIDIFAIAIGNKINNPIII